MNTLQTSISQNVTSTPAKDIHATDNKLSKWIFERTRPFVAGRVLEVDNDKGNISAICIQHNIMTDLLPINLSDPSFGTNYADLFGVFDTVIALNIADQIVSNPQVVINSTKLLKQGGHLLTLLPARTALYNGLDQGLKSWIEDNQVFINKLLRADYKIIKVRYFILGCKSDSTLGDNQILPFIQENIFNKDVPVFSVTAKTNFHKTGLSIIVVGEKR